MGPHQRQSSATPETSAIPASYNQPARFQKPSPPRPTTSLLGSQTHALNVCQGRSATRRPAQGLWRRHRRQQGRRIQPVHRDPGQYDEQGQAVDGQAVIAFHAIVIIKTTYSSSWQIQTWRMTAFSCGLYLDAWWREPESRACVTLTATAPCAPAYAVPRGRRGSWLSGCGPGCARQTPCQRRSPPRRGPARARGSQGGPGVPR